MIVTLSSFLYNNPFRFIHLYLANKNRRNQFFVKFEIRIQGKIRLIDVTRIPEIS